MLFITGSVFKLVHDKKIASTSCLPNSTAASEIDTVLILTTLSSISSLKLPKIGVSTPDKNKVSRSPVLTASTYGDKKTNSFYSKMPTRSN